MMFKTLSTSVAIFCFVFLSSASLSAQTKPHREVGLQFSSLNLNGGGFSAFFKKEMKENVYRRYRFFAGNLNVGVLQEEFHFGISTGLAIGREKRIILDPAFVFYHGPEFRLGINVQSFNEDEVQSSISAGLGWVLGFQHSFNDRWAVNIETIPSAAISFSGNTNNEDSGTVNFDAGISNAVSLGLLRKF